jgi:hypothetical protein
MARSNNQRRRTMKNKGLSFIPAWTKSKVKRQANQAKITALKKQKKLSYNKIVTKSGTVTDRKFHAGGYNNSGKFGAARGNAAHRGKKALGKSGRKTRD